MLRLDKITTAETPAAPPPARKTLLAAVYDFVSPNLPATFILLFCAALFESLGLMLILPFAEVLLAGEPTGASQWAVGVLYQNGLETVPEQLAILGLGFVMLVVLRARVTRYRDRHLLELSQGFVDHERHALFRVLAAAEWPVIKRYRKAHLLNSLTTNVNRLSAAMTFLARGTVSATLTLAALGAAFAISWTLGVLLLSLTLACGLIAWIWSKRSMRSGVQTSRANRELISETTRFLDGLKVAKIAGAETQLEEAFTESVRKGRAIQLAFADQQARLRGGVQIASALTAVLVLTVGHGLLGLSGSELLVMATIVLRLSPSLLSTLSGMQTLAHCWPAYSSMQDLKAELERDHDITHGGLRTIVQNRRPEDAMEGLSVRHAGITVMDQHGGATSLLKTDFLHIDTGSFVFISGPSGAGKSTLVELISGLHLPSHGMVQYNDLILSAKTRAFWQTQIALVPQEPFLFDGTIRENLLWPNVEASDDEIWRALALADAARFVGELPCGLDESLFDCGNRLSGGERQRLCIARALISSPKILSLDEATSAVDAITERRIFKNLRNENSGRIILVVSHSLDAMEIGDCLITVSRGQAELSTTGSPHIHV